jgi:hypothetical protein
MSVYRVSLAAAALAIAAVIAPSIVRMERDYRAGARALVLHIAGVAAALEEENNCG